MALTIQGVARKFKMKVGGQEKALTDPNPNFSADEVMLFYSNEYPELTTANVSGPVLKDNEAIYEFKTTVGTKG